MVFLGNCLWKGHYSISSEYTEFPQTSNNRDGKADISDGGEATSIEDGEAVSIGDMEVHWQIKFFRIIGSTSLTLSNASYTSPSLLRRSHSFLINALPLTGGILWDCEFNLYCNSASTWWDSAFDFINLSWGYRR